MSRIEQLQKFLAQNPKDSFLNHALALEYIKLEDDESAITYFEENLRNEPGYIATYYHLGKLLERAERTSDAISMYENGMKMAKQAGDMHTYNELQAAYEDLAY